MARYQLRRPSPVTVFPRRVRREAATTSTMLVPTASGAPEEEEEEEEGPESPDSPESSPSIAGADSDSDDSDSEDEKEPPSPAGNSTVPAASQAATPGNPMPISLPASSVNRPSATLSAPAGPQVSSIPGSSRIASVAPSVVAQSSSDRPAFTLSFSSRGNLGAVPQVTETPSLTTTTRSAATSTLAPNFSSRLARPTNPDAPSATVLPPVPAQSESAGQNESPQRSSPHHENTIITKGGAAAAITLSILGKHPIPNPPRLHI
jgi:hypothetical protein